MATIVSKFYFHPN